MNTKSLHEATSRSVEYLLNFEPGSYRDFGDQLSHGASLAWTIACVASTLKELGATWRLKKMTDFLLSLQGSEGEWSYNTIVPGDADSTLRAIQCLLKAGYSYDSTPVAKGVWFVVKHQQADGGIATFLPEAVASLGYNNYEGWTASHSCVTALASRILPRSPAQKRAREFVLSRLRKGQAGAYWWLSPWYVRYEAGVRNGEPISNDPVDLGLYLLLQSKLKIADPYNLHRLWSLQLEDGGFPVSHQFRIPRPDQLSPTPEDEVVPDRSRILATSAAGVALERQRKLH